MNLRRLIPLAVLVAGAGLFFMLGGGRYLNFSTLADNRDWLLEQVAHNKPGAALLYIAAYVSLAALSIPGGIWLTMTGGFLFGSLLGTVCTIIGATLGATVPFLAARTGLAGLAARASPMLASIEAGFRRNAFLYMLVLRLVPVFPFWLVNLAAGAAALPFAIFVSATLIGIVPVTFMLASIGQGLGAALDERQPPDLGLLSRPDILLPLLGFALLALLPVLYRLWSGRRRPAM